MIWNENIECMDREQMRELQSSRLKEMAEYVYHNTPFYRKKFQEMGLEPGDIQGLDDLHKLPFTDKLDLRDTYPYGLAAVPMSQVVRIHASSGTTGKPIVVLSTRKDLAMWAESISRAFCAYGATKDDLWATVLCCTPSYAMFLGEALREAEWPREDFKLRIGAFGAEPWTEEMRAKLQETLGIKAYDLYGLSEMAGPGVGFECECQHGTHLNEDYYYPEIVDPKTGEPLPEGTFGELTFTHLTKEAMPLLRYRTHDLTALHYEKCSCGRTLVRMERILGRCDDMLIIRGVNVFPSQIEAVILSLPEFEPHFLLVVDRVNNTDTSELRVEVREEYYTDEMGQMVGLQRKLEAELRSVIGLGFKIRLVEPKGIERSTGKARRVIDNRKI